MRCNLSTVCSKDGQDDQILSLDHLVRETEKDVLNLNASKAQSLNTPDNQFIKNANDHPNCERGEDVCAKPEKFSEDYRLVTERCDISLVKTVRCFKRSSMTMAKGEVSFFRIVYF